MPKRCLINTVALLLVLLLLLSNSNDSKALSDKQKSQTQNPPPPRKSPAYSCLEQTIENPDHLCVTPVPTGTIESSKTPLPVLSPSESPLPISTPAEPPLSIPTSDAPKRKNFSLELPGYENEHFFHPGAFQFCDIISKEISARISGENIPKIIITGYADGGKNRGILKGKEIPTDRCRIVQAEKINDADLARLRSCVIWDLLLVSLEKENVIIGYGWGKPNLENMFSWDRDKFKDIEDGGSTKKEDRKVVVEVIWQ